MAQRAENKPVFTERSALCAFTYELRRNNGMKNVKRGEIYYADLSPVIGSEQDGTRPVLILQNDVGNRFSPTPIVAPITSRVKRNRLPTHVSIYAEGLRCESVALLEQIRTIDKTRFGEYIGKLDKDTMGRIDYALIASFGLKYMEVLLG